MEKILANISASLVAPRNLDQAINSALEEIGTYLNLCHIYMMEVQTGKQSVSLTHEWCAPGISSHQNQFQEIPLESVPKWMESLAKNQNIIIPDPRNTFFKGDFSPFESQEIKTLLIIPMWEHDHLSGFICFEDLSNPRDWQDEHIRSLRMIAEIFRRSIIAYHTEEELRKTRDQLEAVFNCIADPLDVIDQSYNVVMCNPARAAHQNKKAQDMIGKKCYEAFHNLSSPCIVCAVADVFQTGRPSYRMRCRKKADGMETWADVFAFPIRNSLGDVTQAVEFARDITPRKKAEDEIQKLYDEMELKVEERTQKLKDIQEQLIHKEKLAIIGQLIGSVGHEFRSSLSILSGTLYMLKNRGDKESIEEFIDTLEEEIHKMSRFTEDLLDFSRTSPPNFEPVNAGKLLQKLIQKMDIPSNINIILDFPENFTPGYVDANHAEQIFYNLISNAKESMPSGGNLTIKGTEEKSKIIVSFTDTGVGISPINIRKIFTPLFTTKSKGTGLGLSIVNMLIKKNKGAISVESIPQKGTTFYVSFQKNQTLESTSIE